MAVKLQLNLRAKETLPTNGCEEYSSIISPESLISEWTALNVIPCWDGSKEEKLIP